MYSTRVDRNGDRLVLTVTPEMQEELHLKPGDLLNIEVPARPRRRFAPGQLLREHAAVLDQLDDNRDWIDAKPVGREIL